MLLVWEHIHPSVCGSWWHTTPRSLSQLLCVLFPAPQKAAAQIRLAGVSFGELACLESTKTSYRVANCSTCKLASPSLALLSCTAANGRGEQCHYRRELDRCLRYHSTSRSYVTRRSRPASSSHLKYHGLQGVSYDCYGL